MPTTGRRKLLALFGDRPFLLSLVVCLSDFCLPWQQVRYYYVLLALLVFAAPVALSSSLFLRAPKIPRTASFLPQAVNQRCE